MACGAKARDGTSFCRRPGHYNSAVEVNRVQSAATVVLKPPRRSERVQQIAAKAAAASAQHDLIDLTYDTSFPAALSHKSSNLAEQKPKVKKSTRAARTGRKAVPPSSIPGTDGTCPKTFTELVRLLFKTSTASPVYDDGSGDEGFRGREMILKFADAEAEYELRIKPQDHRDSKNFPQVLQQLPTPPIVPYASKPANVVVSNDIDCDLNRRSGTVGHGAHASSFIPSFEPSHSHPREPGGTSMLDADENAGIRANASIPVPRVSESRSGFPALYGTQLHRDLTTSRAVAAAAHRRSMGGAHTQKRNPLFVGVSESSSEEDIPRSGMLASVDGDGYESEADEVF